MWTAFLWEHRAETLSFCCYVSGRSIFLSRSCAGRSVPGRELVRIRIDIRIRIRTAGTKCLLCGYSRKCVTELGKNGTEQVNFLIGSAFGNAAGE
jgi:hypothetical protein